MRNSSTNSGHIALENGLASIHPHDVGADRIRGNDGGNHLVGTDGHDRIFGGAGNDRIKGGNGNDTLNGGDGRDTFIFDSNNEGHDRITDFNSVDHIRFQVRQDEANGPRQYEDLTFRETGHGTFVSYGDDGSTILLVGVTIDQIDPTQFVFL